MELTDLGGSPELDRLDAGVLGLVRHILETQAESVRSFAQHARADDGAYQPVAAPDVGDEVVSSLHKWVLDYLEAAKPMSELIVGVRDWRMLPR
eukprot:1580697-Rhodomonas_salina.3